MNDRLVAYGVAAALAFGATVALLALLAANGDQAGVAALSAEGFNPGLGTLLP